MLQALFNIARNRVHAAAPRKPLITQTRAFSARNIQWHRTYASSVDKSAKHHILATLDPSNNSAAPQELLDASEESEVLLSCRGRPDASVRIRYSIDGNFPANTRGVLYYAPAKRHRHIRFRLCDSVVDFGRGSDLLKSNGRRWTLSLQHMTCRLGQYRPLLDMITEEHPSSATDIDGMLSKLRIIRTLLPREFAAKGQAVFDISDIQRVEPQFSAPGGDNSLIYYHGREHSHVPFPANTKGVFYYKQSTTAPYSIGELRFRLCSDVASFDAGRDLSFSPGLPWCISSDHLLSMPSYSTIRKHLIHEGLLEQPLHLHTDARCIPIISSLNQPFAVDLAHTHTWLRFKVGANIGKELNLFLFGTRSASFYTGRAVVQFEKYPSEYLRGRCLKQNPLFALRFLEFLTPVDAKPDVGSLPIEPPKVGGLLLRRYRGHYFPWGYSPHNSTVYEQLSKLVDQPLASE